MSNKVSKIIFNIPEEVKNEFQETCSKLKINMTKFLVSSIMDFNKKAKQKP